MTTTATRPRTSPPVAREDPGPFRAGVASGHDGAALGEAAWPSEGGEGAPPALAGALAQVEAAIATLDEVELAGEADEAVGAASVTLHRQANRLQARVVELLGEVDARQAHERDGAVSAKQWFRSRARCEPGEAGALVTASRRLRRLSRLSAAFADGTVSWAHTQAITKAAVPQRAEAIRALEDPLVELAERALPRDVRTAVARIRDHADPDGSDASPLPDAGPDPRRGLTVRPTVDGLGELDGPLDPVTTEWLRTLLDAFDTPDQPDTPADQRRSPAQRRHDALHDLLTKVAAKPETPTVQGARPHVLVMVDMATLAGVDCQATRAPRLGYGGETTPELARQLATDARVTAVQTMGPWHPVDVGRSQRTLPAWLRDLLQMIHDICRGPDCDRPATWSEAHHLQAWGEGGHTDLNESVPLCTHHHDMVTHGGWTVTMDPETLVCTWTSPSGKVRRTHPPPPG